MPVSALQPSLTHLEDLAWSIRAEFREMPGMHLTFAQVKRLWNLSPDDCELVLEYLLSAGVLTQDEDNRFCRAEA